VVDDAHLRPDLQTNNFVWGNTVASRYDSSQSFLPSFYFAVTEFGRLLTFFDRIRVIFYAQLRSSVRCAARYASYASKIHTRLPPLLI
jgi:hypothetical protein